MRTLILLELTLLAMTITTYDAYNRIPSLQTDRVKDFLHTHLEEFGDTPSAIKKSIEYTAKQGSGFGGYTIIVEYEKNIIGALVINRTGMEEYAPENILVYMATHAEHRGQGIARKLMEKAMLLCKGDIALHIQENNPARKIYEKFGFTHPCLEMRLSR